MIFAGAFTPPSAQAHAHDAPRPTFSVTLLTPSVTSTTDLHSQYQLVRQPKSNTVTPLAECSGPATKSCYRLSVDCFLPSLSAPPFHQPPSGPKFVAPPGEATLWTTFFALCLQAEASTAGGPRAVQYLGPTCIAKCVQSCEAAVRL